MILIFVCITVSLYSVIFRIRSSSRLSMITRFLHFIVFFIVLPLIYEVSLLFCLSIRLSFVKIHHFESTFSLLSLLSLGSYFRILFYMRFISSLNRQLNSLTLLFIARISISHFIRLCYCCCSGLSLAAVTTIQLFLLILRFSYLLTAIR